MELRNPEYTVQPLQFGKIALFCNRCHRNILIAPKEQWLDFTRNTPWLAIKGQHFMSEEHQQNAILARLA